jgi:predicted amidophosphoribosyltransferase
MESDSQTGKSRTDRVMNVSKVFEIAQKETLQNKHVLIVDDVITTGATVEACCLKALEAGASKISILCIAATA